VTCDLLFIYPCPNLQQRLRAQALEHHRRAANEIDATGTPKAFAQPTEKQFDAEPISGDA
jgi:hypothetical protein